MCFCCSSVVEGDATWRRDATLRCHAYSPYDTVIVRSVYRLTRVFRVRCRSCRKLRYIRTALRSFDRSCVFDAVAVILRHAKIAGTWRSSRVLATSSLVAWGLILHGTTINCIGTRQSASEWCSRICYGNERKNPKVERRMNGSGCISPENMADSCQLELLFPLSSLISLVTGQIFVLECVFVWKMYRQPL